jgi:hypothetical protein
MTINISPDPRLQFFGNDGKPLVGGKLYTYEAGTTTPLVTYTNYLGTTPNSNPVILDSRGEASVWLGNGTRYKFVLKDANNVEIWTQDYLIAGVGADGSGAYGTWPISISGNAATATNATHATSADSATYATTAGSVSGGAVSSINGAGLYGFSLTGGPITSSGTLTVTPPAPGAAGNHLVSNGTNWVSQATSAAGTQNFQWFFSSGTFTVPAGASQIYVLLWGGGAGNAGGGTGGSGGSAQGIYTVTPGTSYTVTIGSGGIGKNPGAGTGTDGGTSSFGSLITCTGGTCIGGATGTGTATTSFIQTTGPSSTGISIIPVTTGIIQWGYVQNISGGTAPPIAASFNSFPGVGGNLYYPGYSIGAGGTGGAAYVQWV